MRSLLLLTLVALAVLTAGASSASAQTPIRVGIGDQQVSMFDQDAFQRAKIKRVRYFIPWNAMDNPAERLAATRLRAACARRGHAGLPARLQRRPAHQAGQAPVGRAVPHPKVGRLVRYFRALGVREFGAWNEANHASQPTYRSPTRAAAVLPRDVPRWSSRAARGCARRRARRARPDRRRALHAQLLPRAVARRYRRRATIVGIHNYGDVNRKRTTFTAQHHPPGARLQPRDEVLVHRDRRHREVRPHASRAARAAPRAGLKQHVPPRPAATAPAACSACTSTTGPARAATRASTRG